MYLKLASSEKERNCDGGSYVRKLGSDSKYHFTSHRETASAPPSPITHICKSVSDDITRELHIPKKVHFEAKNIYPIHNKSKVLKGVSHNCNWYDAGH